MIYVLIYGMQWFKCLYSQYFLYKYYEYTAADKYDKVKDTYFVTTSM